MYPNNFYWRKRTRPIFRQKAGKKISLLLTALSPSFPSSRLLIHLLPRRRRMPPPAGLLPWPAPSAARLAAPTRTRPPPRTRVRPPPPPAPPPPPPPRLEPVVVVAPSTTTATATLPPIITPTLSPSTSTCLECVHFNSYGSLSSNACARV